VSEEKKTYKIELTRDELYALITYIGACPNLKDRPDINKHIINIKGRFIELYHKKVD